MDIYKKIVELKSKGTPSALVTVIKTNGSVPRDVGSKMIVEANGQIHGTIGGSSVEDLVIHLTIDMIKSGKAGIVKHDLFDKEENDTGMVCGGSMEFYIEPLATTERLIIFGGGHVGYALANFAKDLGYDCIIVDQRPEYANAQRFPWASDCIADDPERIAAEFETQNTDYIVIVTHGHKHDYVALKGVINKPFRYLGMIGSKVKRNEIYQKLKNIDGIGDDKIEQVHCPIGLSIKAQTPEEIAISILAEMIAVRRGE